MIQEEITFEILRKTDFKIFLKALFIDVGLPEPSFIQYLIADHLQYGGKEIGVTGYRKMTKTYITTAYSLWRLDIDPTVIIAVINNKASSSSLTVGLAKQWINSVSWLSHLSPGNFELSKDAPSALKDNALCFDVPGKGMNRMPSFASYSVNQGIDGMRAIIVIADDMEDKKNSTTASKRDKIKGVANEITNIVENDKHTDYKIIILGTPKHEDDSIYHHFRKIGFNFITIPIIFPDKKQETRDLAPPLKKLMDSGDPRYAPGMPTNPERFGVDEVNAIRMNVGELDFALEYMLQENMVDVDLRPLKLNQLIVMPCNRDTAPEVIDHGKMNIHGSTECKDIESMGFNEDKLYSAKYISDKWLRYTHTVCFIDPSGGSAKGDETVLTVVGHLNGNFFAKNQTTYIGDHSPENIAKMVLAMRKYGARSCFIEQNNGGNALANLIKPVIKDYSCDPRIPAKDGWAHPDGWSCQVETRHSHKQKEIRIIDAIRPVINSGRLIVDPSIVDFNGEKTDITNQFQYQFTRLTAERNCLRHDDRIDSLAGAISELTELLSISDRQRAIQSEEERQSNKRITYISTFDGTYITGSGYNSNVNYSWDDAL